MKAIASKLIDCKMDQMNEVVIVRCATLYPHGCNSLFLVSLSLFRTNSFWMLVCSRCTERVFGQYQWETLRTKLATWRVNFLFYFS